MRVSSHLALKVLNVFRIITTAVYGVLIPLLFYVMTANVCQRIALAHRDLLDFLYLSNWAPDVKLKTVQLEDSGKVSHSMRSLMRAVDQTFPARTLPVYVITHPTEFLTMMVTLNTGTTVSRVSQHVIHAAAAFAGFQASTLATVAHEMGHVHQHESAKISADLAAMDAKLKGTQQELYSDLFAVEIFRSMSHQDPRDDADIAASLDFLKSVRGIAGRPPDENLKIYDRIHQTGEFLNRYLTMCSGMTQTALPLDTAFATGVYDRMAACMNGLNMPAPAAPKRHHFDLIQALHCERWCSESPTDPQLAKLTP